MNIHCKWSIGYHRHRHQSSVTGIICTYILCERRILSDDYKPLWILSCEKTMSIHFHSASNFAFGFFFLSMLQSCNNNSISSRNNNKIKQTNKWTKMNGWRNNEIFSEREREKGSRKKPSIRQRTTYMIPI